MSVIVNEGERVIPGDVLATLHEGIASSEAEESAIEPRAGHGTALRRAALKRHREQQQSSSSSSSLSSTGKQEHNEDGTKALVTRHIVATRCGIVHWGEDSSVSVISPPAGSSGSSSFAQHPAVADSTQVSSTSESAHHQNSAGAAAGDLVHVRITRVTKLFAVGEVIAIRGQWCCQKSGGAHSGFRGLLRVEDIKPFRPTKEKLTPDPPIDSVRPGDVVVAAVISQADAKVYQLTTCAEHCGVVEAMTAKSANTLVELFPSKPVPLAPIAMKRDGLRNPLTGETVKRWTPLISK